MITQSRFRFFVSSIMLCAHAHAISLLDAYEGAFENDLGYQASKFAWMRDQNNAGIALGTLLPQASIQAQSNAGSQRFIKSFNGNKIYASSESLQISLQQVLLNLSNYANYQAASSQAQQALLEFNHATQHLMVQTTELYTHVLLAIDNLSFAMAEQEEVFMRYKDVNQKVQAGIMTPTDLAETQAQLERIKAEVIAAKQQVSQTQDALSDSIGIKFTKIHGLGEKKHAYEKRLTPLKNWIQSGLENSLEVQIATQNLKTAHAQKRAQQYTYAPSIQGYANMDFQRNYSAADSGFLQNSVLFSSFNQKTVGVSMQYPILTGGVRYHSVRKTSENEGYFHALALRSKQFNTREIRTLYQRLESGKQIIRANAQALTYSKELVKMNRLKLEAGTTTMLEVLDNISNLRSDQQALAKARYDFILNLLKLKLAAGTIDTDDIRDINRYFTKSLSLEKDTYYK